MGRRPMSCFVCLRRLTWRALFGVPLMLMLGCGQQLYGALDERGANEVVGALRADGIRAAKDRSGDGQWSVTVPDDEFARAVAVLQRRNLPRREFDGLGQVFRKDSLVSTPTEERARLMHALSQELERTLGELDGVLVARVHPVIPPQDPLSNKARAASASVFIKHRPGADLAEREAVIRGLVASGIEGLTYDTVKVLLVASESATPAVEPAPPVSRSIPPVFWAVLAVLVGVLVVSSFVLSWRDRSVATLDSLRGRLIRRQQAGVVQPRAGGK